MLKTSERVALARPPPRSNGKGSCPRLSKILRLLRQLTAHNVLAKRLSASGGESVAVVPERGAPTLIG